MKPLNSLLNDLESSDVVERLAAIIALGERGDPVAVAPLLVCLDDPEPEIRREAVLALRRIDDPRAYLPLILKLADADNRVRRRVSAWVMSMGRDPRLVEPLIAVLQNTDHRLAVREFTAMALGNIGDDRAVEPLHAALFDAPPPLQRRIVHSLSIMPDARAIPGLAQMLTSEDIPTRKIAAKTLRQIGTPEALRHLEG